MTNEEWQNRIELKIDKLHDKQDSFFTQQVKQGGDIEYHIKRTDLLERRVNVSEKIGLAVVILTALLKLWQILFQR